jgi:phosphate transport system substrate-binding protein
MHISGKKPGRLFWRFLIVSAFIVLTGGESTSAAEVVTLRIGGTGGAIGAMKELAAAFQKKHPGTTVDVIPHLGTRGGISGLLKGAIDIGLAGRHLNPQELAQGLRGVEYAQSPFVFVTRSKNQRLDLSHNLIAGIYRGEIKNWPDGTPIRPVLRPEGDVDILMLKEISPEIRDAVSRAQSREGMTFARDDQQNCDLLEKVRGSFGTSTLTQIVSEKRSLTLLPLNGVAPSISTMAAGRYPHYKPFVMVTGPRSSSQARKFIKFVKSAEGEKILEQTGNHVPRAH